jgi:tripartite-type tricarboxylate transporter receptor subunit TctC
MPAFTPARLIASAAAALLAFDAVPAAAQDGPGPLTVVVPYPAGGGNDLFARLMAARMTASLGRQVIVDNRSGASGSIGTAAVVRAPADGNTLLYAASTIAMSQSVYKTLPYDAGRDLQAVTVTLTIPFVLASHPSLPVANGRQFVAFAKAHPNEIAYSSGGVGSAPHFAMAALNLKAGLEQRHVPYRGAAPSLTALVSGESQVSFIVPPLVAAYVGSGKLKALAISSAERSPALPALPTLQESGVAGYEVMQWHAFFVPAKTPAAAIERLYGAVSEALGSADLKAKLDAAGAHKVGTPPAQSQAYFLKEIADWAEVARRAGISL